MTGAMAEQATQWGRVEADGSVSVLLDGSWHHIGAFPDGTPEEALAFYRKKGEDLEAQVVLAEQRSRAGANAKDLARSLTKLEADLAAPTCIADIENLRRRVASLKESVSALADKQKEERDKAVAEALEQREALVVEMETLAQTPAEKIRWKETTAQVQNLFQKWQEHQQSGPRLPKAQADELWKRFRQARGSLDRARRAHFQERDKAGKEAKSVKKTLIEKAEALAPQGSAGIPAYRALLEQWKTAPRGIRSVDEALWAKFKAAGDALYQAKAEADQRDDEAHRANGDAKKALIDEFADILSLADHHVASERLRLFSDRFRSIGPVPRGMVKDVEQAVKKFEAHVKALHQAHWDKTNPEKQARSNSLLSQLTQQIASLEKDLEVATAANDASAQQRIQAELETKRSWLAVVDSN